MALSKERLEAEIKHTKETMINLKGIENDSISGYELNVIILKCLEDALKSNS